MIHAPILTAASPKWPHYALLILQALEILSLLPWSSTAGLSFAVFTSAASEDNPLLWAFVGAVWSYPFWLLAGGLASWRLLLRWPPVGPVALGAIFALHALVVVLWIVGLSLFAISNQGLPMPHLSANSSRYEPRSANRSEASNLHASKPAG